MKALVLAATHERAIDSHGIEVPRPLLDLDEEPLLTVMARRLTALPGVDQMVVVTNDAIRPKLEAWRRGLPHGLLPISVLGDGTRTHDERLGAMGDILFSLEAAPVDDDLLVIGGDNWFAYDLRVLIDAGRERSPAVVVTLLQPGNRTSRFGIAQVDAEGRIIAFVEKPSQMRSGYKASCAYYFRRRDLDWLRAFASEHDTRCSPGSFLEWLVPRTAVQGVRVDSAWYDVGDNEGQKLSGPGLLRFRQVIREVVNPTRSTWERTAGRRLQWVSSHEDLLDVLHDPDPNLKIVASHVLGLIGDLVDGGARSEITNRLVGLLRDPSINQIAYAGTQTDEESMVCVAAIAASSLVSLGYASDAKAVFGRARAEGIDVHESYEAKW